MQGSQEKAHQAIEALLKGNQITVHQSPGSRDYYTEGITKLTLKAQPAGRPETTGRLVSVVAGARSDRLHTVPHGIFVQMQISA